MKWISFISTLALLTAPAALADFSIGGELLGVTRDLELGSLELESDDGQAFAVFVGFDIGNSMMYLKHTQEETDFDAGNGIAWTYERSDTALSWNWNETSGKRNYKNVSVGISLTDYQVAPGVEAEFFGFSAGGGLTHFLGKRFFVNARLRYRLLAGDEEDLFPSSETDETTFGGWEAQAAFGVQLGRKSSWSLQLGYKIHDIDFRGRFVDDELQHGFVTVRVFVPSGK